MKRIIVIILGQALGVTIGLLLFSLIYNFYEEKGPTPGVNYSSTSVVNEYPAATVVKIEERSYIYAEETGEEVVEVFVISDGKSFDLAIVSNNESIPKDCKFMLRLCDSKTNATSYVAWPKYNLTKK